MSTDEETDKEDVRLCVYIYIHIHIYTQCIWNGMESLLFSHWVMSNSLAALWTVAGQVPLSMGFCKQEYWRKLQFPLQEICLTLWSNLCLRHWQVYSNGILAFKKIRKNCKLSVIQATRNNKGNISAYRKVRYVFSV